MRSSSTLIPPIDGRLRRSFVRSVFEKKRQWRLNDVVRRGRSAAGAAFLAR
jgi:hypothetical protein